MATKKTTKETKPEETAAAEATTKKKAEPEVDPMEEYVEVELFKDNGRYSGDVYVSVNDESILIQRGTPVKIKRKFWEVLKQSQEQENKAARLISDLTTK